MTDLLDGRAVLLQWTKPPPSLKLHPIPNPMPFAESCPFLLGGEEGGGPETEDCPLYR